MEYKLNVLAKLRDRFYDELEERSKNFSEEYVRAGFINKTLELFGWDLSNTNEVIQEKIITNLSTRNKLISIDSTHKKPDYQLLDRGVLKLYLDAKNVTPNFLEDPAVSFQIRSYGWSAGLNFSIVSDFQNFRVYDTRIKPSYDMPPDYQTITFSIDELIESPDKYFQFLDKNKVQSNDWNLDNFAIEIEEGYQKTLDSDFITLIDDLQLELARGILENSPNITLSNLQYFVQAIINRLLFLRVLEAINYEPEGGLLQWLENGEGFWKQFNDSCMNAYNEKYDGAMYEFHIPNTIKINDSFFKTFIESLYRFTPYRFNAIEPEFIAEMYDHFLGKELYINKSNVYIRNKKTSPKGSIPTPPELANYVVENVLELDNITNEQELLACKILDSSAGSGIFLVTSLDKLISKMKEIKNEEVLPYEDIKLIVASCLFGVDIDPVAIEVLKMTMSLKLVMTQHLKPEPLEKILGDFSQNFRLGNSIVEKDIFSRFQLPDDEKYEQIPTNYAELFPEILQNGGFSFIITNPPYIEPKHFKENWPVTYDYLRDKYLIKGKTDISMFFLERVFDLLCENGKLAIVIQKRFFTTAYGKAIRDWLAEEQFLIKIKEYMSNDLFKFRTTYIATLYCRKCSNSSLEYSVSLNDVKKDRSNLRDVIEKDDFNTTISSNELKISPTWSYRYFRNSKLISKLKEQDAFYTINDSDRLKVTVGPQALDKQYYFIRNCSKINRTIEGEISFINPQTRNIEIKNIKIEEALAKRIYENYNLNSFVDFSKEKIKTYLVFPYDESASLIQLNDLKEHYPLAYNYLTWMDRMSTNQRRANSDEFYGYTRNQNLKLIDKAKIFIPMTAKRVIASFSNGDIYGDNSNINAIVDVKENDKNLLKALTLIFNSEIFSLLTISLSGEARGGYYKMNKQFIGEVPIPILSTKEINELVNIYDEITNTIDRYKNSFGEQSKLIYSRLEHLQEINNNFIYSKYNLDDQDKLSLSANIDTSTLDWLKNMRWLG